MVEELSREIRKLEVRLERFVTEEEGFVKRILSEYLQYSRAHILKIII